MNDVCLLYAEYHADYGDVVKVETERRIQYGVDWVILTMFGVLIDIDLLKKVTRPIRNRK